MKEFKIHWICLTGSELGQWNSVEEYHDTEDQCRAVLEGHGPRPKAWWEASILKRHKTVFLVIEHIQRKRKEAALEVA